jgi:plasmid maintenance system antidote protein VapI
MANGGTKVRAEIIKHLCIDRGIDPTPAAIAKFTGIPGRSVRYMLDGRPVSMTNAMKLRAAFGAGPELFDVTIPPPRQPVRSEWAEA